MSPRPRTVQDSAILDAAIEVLGRIGYELVTESTDRLGVCNRLNLLLVDRENHLIVDYMTNALP